VFTIQDNNKIDPRNHFKSNEEFNDFMEKIDLKLKAKGVPIVARQVYRHMLFYGLTGVMVID